MARKSRSLTSNAAAIGIAANAAVAAEKGDDEVLRDMLLLARNEAARLKGQNPRGYATRMELGNCYEAMSSLIALLYRVASERAAPAPTPPAPEPKPSDPIARKARLRKAAAASTVPVPSLSQELAKAGE